MIERHCIRRGEVVDTYGGDFTYRNTWLEIDKGVERFFYEDYGAKPTNEPVEITDQREIESLEWYMARYREDGSRI